MRNYDRLEELSGAVAGGLAAGRFVLALDQATSMSELDEAGQRSLRDGVALLRTVAGPDEKAPPRRRGGGRRMASGNNALDLIEVVQQRVPQDDEFADYIERLALAVEQVLSGGDANEEDLRRVIDIFQAVGDLELARGAAIVRHRGEASTWRRFATT